VNDDELLERVKAAAKHDTAPHELAERVLDTVAYRARLEAPLVERRNKRARLALGAGAVALVAATALSINALRAPLEPRIAAEPPAAGSGAARETSSAPAPQPVPDPCSARVVATGSAPLIDDFEDGDDALTPLDGRNGFWRWARESDAPGTAPALFPVPRADAKPRNRLALRAKGGQLFDWGATVEFNFRPPCYDATAYTGVAVQARGPGRIFVSLREVGVIPPFEGGTCSQDCYNSHAAKLELGREWRTYEVPWAELRQRGLGKPPLDPSRLHSVAFLIRPEDTPYDVWLDDVRFLTRP
jgi:hypothetical protein